MMYSSKQFNILFADIDECDENLDNCDENADCENEPGTFSCTCKEGYTGDGVTCNGKVTHLVPLIIGLKLA